MGSLRYFLFDDAYKNDNKEDITLYYRYLFFIITFFEIFSYIHMLRLKNHYYMSLVLRSCKICK